MSYIIHSQGPWKKHKYIKKVGDSYVYSDTDKDTTNKTDEVSDDNVNEVLSKMGLTKSRIVDVKLKKASGKSSSKKSDKNSSGKAGKGEKEPKEKTTKEPKNKTSEKENTNNTKSNNNQENDVVKKARYEHAVNQAKKKWGLKDGETISQRENDNGTITITIKRLDGKTDVYTVDKNYNEVNKELKHSSSLYAIKFY